MKKNFVILSIESSCDETACAIVRDGREVLSNVVASQIDIHRRFGGVVPEIASRNHSLAIENVVKEALYKAGMGKDDIDALAVTYGAGLLGALLVGVNFAKALAYAWKKPLYGVSHIKGHIAANYIGSDLTPPYLTLLASGGHTALLRIADYDKTEYIASSRDDAAGEAFDKVARILSLPYPGGPEIEKLAKSGNCIYEMPEVHIKDELYFSYSGLKTHVINLVHKLESASSPYKKEDIAASFQKAAVEQLVDMTKRALAITGDKKLAIAGGVSANALLRREVDKLKEQGVEVHYPKLCYCTDNAAMIGAAAYYMAYCNVPPSPLTLDAQATVPLK